MAPIHPRLLEKKKAVVARELLLARTLSCNEKSDRDKAMRKLTRWLQLRSQSTHHFSDHDFLRLWKGLFYCVWMSDKPLVQEELCEKIADLFKCFGKRNISSSILFYKCFLATMAADWFGIDQHRIDKFLMLVRRVTRGVLLCLRDADWSVESTDLLENCLCGAEGLFCPTPATQARMALGLQLHLVDCWAEEVAKVGEGKITPEATMRVMKPFAMYLCLGKETRLSSAIMKNIFVHLISQTDLGLEYEEKKKAWFGAGFPGGSVDAMEKVELSDEEEEEDVDDDDDKGNDEENDDDVQMTALDPRAGRVNVELAQLPVVGRLYSEMFQDLISNAQTSKSNRTRMKDLMKSFQMMDANEYPYKLKDLNVPDRAELKIPKAAKAAVELMEFEHNVLEENEDEQLKGLNKRQKRRIMAKQRKKRLRMSEGSVSTNVPAKKNKHVENGTSPGKKLKETKKKITENKQGKASPGSKDTSKMSAATKKMTMKTDKEKKKSSPETSKSFTKIDKKVIKKRKKKIAGGSPIKNLESVVKNMTSNAETEIVIPIKKATKKLNGEAANVTPKGNNKKIASTPGSSSKKVNIKLSKNTSHSVLDYFKSVRQSPDIPYDGEKKPTRTSLKPNSMPSPINPFFKKKLQLSFV